MTQFKIPPSSRLIDKQVVNVQGPDGVTTTFQFDSETKTLYSRESPILIPPFHGQTHIAEDPVPIATPDTQGHMSPSDKAKLDALTQTRLGILGFAGSGFSDDGGFLQGDIILASGSELLSIERIGNVVRFTVDQTVQFCDCEECAQIFWIQDESDISAIRPPACAGRLPDVNIYGEFSVHMLPENTFLDSANPIPTLDEKVNVPGFNFTRFTDSVVPNQAELDLVLSRNPNGTSLVGWSMTPGATGKVETVWFTGKDNEGRQIRFELEPNENADLLGSILYKGHSLTRQMAVITGYTSTILSTNQYTVRNWDVLNAQAVGDKFTATNVWRYNNAENSPNDISAPQRQMLDATVDLIPIGTLVQIWEFQVGEINGERILRRFFNLEPKLNPETVWSLSGAIKFGDTYTARDERSPLGSTGNLDASITNVSDIRTIEKSNWGITGFEDPLLLSDDGVGTDITGGPSIAASVTAVSGNDPSIAQPNTTISVSETLVVNEHVDDVLLLKSGVLSGQQFLIIANDSSSVTVFGEIDDDVAVGDLISIIGVVDSMEPSGIPINNQYVADIDPTLPGLIVSTSDPSIDNERPVYLWHRGNHFNTYLKALIGQPDSSSFPPIDILLRSPGDSFGDTYVRIIRRGVIQSGVYAGRHFVAIKGVRWEDLPQKGHLRTLTGLSRNEVWPFFFKTAFSPFDDSTILIGNKTQQFVFDDDFITADTSPTTVGSRPVPLATTVAELLHLDFSGPAVRLEFSVNDDSGGESVQLQARSGILDMSEVYELERSTEAEDDLVRGFRPGKFAVSRIMTQQGFIESIEDPDSDPLGFRVYQGGFLPTIIDGEDERWNTLEIMVRDNQIWIWWNQLLVPPDPILSAQLPIPVTINTPYFPILDDSFNLGKVIFRLWPGTKIRQVELRDQNMSFSEFSHGQLEISV